MKKVLFCLASCFSMSGLHAQATSESISNYIHSVTSGPPIYFNLNVPNNMKDAIALFQAQAKGVTQTLEGVRLLTQEVWDKVTAEYASASQALEEARAVDYRFSSVDRQSTLVKAQQRLLKAQGDYEAAKTLRQQLLIKGTLQVFKEIDEANSERQDTKMKAAEEGFGKAESEELRKSGDRSGQTEDLTRAKDETPKND